MEQPLSPESVGVGGAEGKREQILKAALTVFGQRGFHQAQMDEVAQTAGVGKGTLYHHFESKEALLREAILYLMDLHYAELEKSWATAKDPLEKLYQSVYTDYSFLLTYADMARVAFTEAAGVGFSPAFRSSVMEVRKRHKAAVMEIMREGQELGLLRADLCPELLALAFIGMGKELAFEFLFAEGEPRDPAEVARGLLAVFLEQLRVEPPQVGLEPRQ